MPGRSEYVSIISMIIFAQIMLSMISSLHHCSRSSCQDSVFRSYLVTGRLAGRTIPAAVLQVWCSSGFQSSSFIKWLSSSWHYQQPKWLLSTSSCYCKCVGTNVSAFPPFNRPTKRRLRHRCCNDSSATSMWLSISLYISCDLYLEHISVLTLRKPHVTVMSCDFLTRPALLTEVP